MSAYIPTSRDIDKILAPTRHRISGGGTRGRGWKQESKAEKQRVCDMRAKRTVKATARMTGTGDSAAYRCFYKAGRTDAEKEASAQKRADAAAQKRADAAAAKKRSEAAKKAAATRKKNREAAIRKAKSSAKSTGRSTRQSTRKKNIANARTRGQRKKAASSGKK